MIQSQDLSVLQPQDSLFDDDHVDVVVVGSGPAGMSAALCASRAKLSVLVIDRNLPGGQATIAYTVSNYLGFPDGIFGPDLASRMEAQLKEYGVTFLCEAVEDIADDGKGHKCVRTDLGKKIKTRAVVLAAGLEPKPLDLSFARRFLGRGISYYAQSDSETYRDKEVAVIGGGNCACYAADYLSQFVKKLTLIHRSDYIKAVQTLKDRVLANDRIDCIWDTELVDAFGIDKVEKIKLKHLATHQETWLDVQGVFIYIGRIPPTDILNVDLQCDENGYVITDEFMRTNIPGIYAAGDIRSKQIRQIATAVSDGMIAAINLDKDLFKK